MGVEQPGKLPLHHFASGGENVVLAGTASQCQARYDSNITTAQNVF